MPPEPYSAGIDRGSPFFGSAAMEDGNDGSALLFVPGMWILRDLLGQIGYVSHGSHGPLIDDFPS